MKLKFDDIEIECTEGYIRALKVLMIEEMKMMKMSDDMHSYCWTWGQCTIGDLADARNLCFVFGSEDDQPKDIAQGGLSVVLDEEIYYENDEQ